MSLGTDHAVETSGGASAQSTEIAGRSLSRIAWGRLRRDKVAMTSLTIVLLVLVIAVFAPLITRVVGVDPITFDQQALDGAAMPQGGPWNSGISAEHPLGVEPLTGRDIFARLLYGARISLLIALSATVVTSTLGVTIGIIAGYSKGWVDTALGRLMDLILAFPLLLILLAMSAPLKQRLRSSFGLEPNQAAVLYIILILSLFGWPYLARIIRGQVLSLREREFVESAISMGAGTPRILFKEILPNLWAPILVYFSILLPTYIAAEATLNFLGVGLVPPAPSWGGMLAESVSFFYTVPTYLFIPGSFLFIVVLAFNLLGDAIRDALDPRAGRV